MSDLVGNPEDRFSHNEAHIIGANRLGVKRLVERNDQKGETYRFLTDVDTNVSQLTSEGAF